MRHQVLRKIAIALAPALVVSVLAVGSPAVAAKPKPKPKYTPAAGPTFNNPYGSTDSRRAIIRKLLKTIDSVPRGEEIRIASWNVRSSNITAALLRANKRGVSVQVVMDGSNWAPDNRNPDAARLAYGLKQGSKKRKKAVNRSWLRRCQSACRGPHGIAHTKFYLFSKSGRAKNVVIYGSNNATELAADIQWNDVYTRVNKPDEYREFLSVFNEMAKDRKPKGGAYRQWNHGPFSAIFYPYSGKAVPSGDPALNVLNKVRCLGATGGTGVHGHTKIRIAQTAMYGDRGIAIAKRLAIMHRRGCDIRLVYAMFGNEVLRIMRQEAGRPIPMTHLAWDRDEDGIYDRYVHMKTLTISGVYDGKTNASVTINGSANWTHVSLVSDEVIGVIRSSYTTKRYSNWIDYLFTHRPSSWGTSTIGQTGNGNGGVERRSLDAPTVDPYALIKQEM
ncbi:phospholipase D-like domain-containing protein [Nocardioides conyzicola]|uniref:phospholipase D-like domain-containing protein n=1 Tax=Nocardioides conyzicola TaxID=1651781 RepID=UPI0031EDE249